MTYLGRAQHEVRQQLVLSSALKCLEAVWLSLDDLHALVDGREHDGLERRNLQILIVVHLVEDVEGNDPLALGQQLQKND